MLQCPGSIPGLTTASAKPDTGTVHRTVFFCVSVAVISALELVSNACAISDSSIVSTFHSTMWCTSPSRHTRPSLTRLLPCWCAARVVMLLIRTCNKMSRAELRFRKKAESQIDQTSAMHMDALFKTCGFYVRASNGFRRYSATAVTSALNYLTVALVKGTLSSLYKKDPAKEKLKMPVEYGCTIHHSHSSCRCSS